MVQVVSKDLLRAYGPSRLRRPIAYLLAYTGAAFSATALIMVLMTQALDPRAFLWLAAALTIFWISWGLLESNPISWKFFQGIGAGLAGGFGLVLFLYALNDFQHWEEITQLNPRLQIILWMLGGIAFMIWAIGLMITRRTATIALQVAMLPASVAATWIWFYFGRLAITDKHLFAVLISVVWLILCMLLLLAFVRPDLHAFISSLTQTDAVTTENFPTKYHELLSRGHLCDIFELPCTTPCPLSTTVASKYQQLRMKHQGSPQVMDALEKAYAILITPRSRELCAIAHELMDIKKKQLGTRRYLALERLLWTKIWKRLQDNEIRSDPVKARAEKQRLMREI